MLISSNYRDMEVSNAQKNRLWEIGYPEPVFYYISMMIGKTIGRRFVFSYNNGAMESIISFLISDHLLAFCFIILFKLSATAFCASLIKSSDSLIYAKPRDIISGPAAILNSFILILTTTITSPASERMRRSR